MSDAAPQSGPFDGAGDLSQETQDLDDPRSTTSSGPTRAQSPPMPMEQELPSSSMRTRRRLTHCQATQSSQTSSTSIEYVPFGLGLYRIVPKAVQPSPLPLQSVPERPALSGTSIATILHRPQSGKTSSSLKRTIASLGVESKCTGRLTPSPCSTEPPSQRPTLSHGSSGSIAQMPTSQTTA